MDNFSDDSRAGAFGSSRCVALRRRVEQHSVVALVSARLRFGCARSFGVYLVFVCARARVFVRTRMFSRLLLPGVQACSRLPGGSG